MSQAVAKRCLPCEGGVRPLNASEVATALKTLPDWRVGEGGKAISRAFKFADFHQTMKFVNQVAEIAHREDHHPDMEVGYNRCLVRYSTHAIDGLSQNDFICAAAVDELG
jgi:4a-hydroxytetrahydrobiopterin dehydratase